MNLQEITAQLRRRIQFNKIPLIIDDAIDYYVTPAWSLSKGDFISDVCDYVVSYFSEDKEEHILPKDKDLLYNFLVDTYGKYLSNRYDKWKKSQDDELSEQSNRIKSMMGLISEQAPPNPLRRRIKMWLIDDSIKKNKIRSFKKDKPIEDSIEGTFNLVAGDVLPYNYDVEGFSNEEFQRMEDNLIAYLYEKYEDELTKYFKRRQAERDKEENEGIVYVFVKHDKPSTRGSNGFSESFYGFDDLLTRFGTWLDVDWDEVKRKLDNINEYPDEQWNGNYGKPLRIASVGDPGNNWGYDFSIVKKKKREN